MEQRTDGLRQGAPARHWAVVAVTWAVYLALIWFNRERHEDLLAPLGVVPLLLTGLLLGPRVGALAGLFAAFTTFGIHMVHGAGDTPLYDLRENAFRWFIGVFLGYGFGRLADMLRRQRRLTQELRDQIAARSSVETRLASKERSWETLLANAPDYVLVIGAQETITYANRTPAGLTVESILGKPIAAFVRDPVQNEAMMAAVRRAIQRGPSSIVELQGPGPNGQLSNYRCRIMPTTEADGSPAALMLNVDITADLAAERRLAEQNQQLALANHLLEEAQSIAHIGSWEADMTTGLAKESPEAWRIWGMRGNPEPRPVADFLALMHPDDKVALDHQVEQALAQGADYESVLRIRGPEHDTWRHVRNRGRIAQRGPDGRVLKLAGTLEDITDRVQADERLRASEERFRLASRATRDVIWDYDILNGRLYWGEAMLDSFGHDPSVLEPGLASWIRRVHPEDVHRVEASFGAALSGSARQWRDEYRFQKADGTWAEVFDRGFVVRGEDGKAIRAVGSMSDISERRQAETQAREAERLREVAAMKTQFLSTAAHELATPLTPLKLQLASLRVHADRLPTAEREALTLLERNVDRLGLLVNDLLDAARLQSGRISLALKPTELAPITQQVVASFAEQARVAGISLASEAGPAGLRAECDEARLLQVLFNLTHNALKFTPRGGQVRIAARRDGANAVLEVRDSGIGLDRAQMDRLFQPFTQVHDGTKVKAGGTGLGLYICRGIVEQHGGVLDVASDGPGHGAVFSVRIPLAVLPAVSSAPTSGPGRPRAGGGPDARQAGP